VLVTGENLAAGAGRDDLATVLRTARVRIQRPDTVVAVVGEFKQGKSSLVNALIGTPICPVDDDIATAVPTVLRYAEAAAARVQVRDDDEDRSVVVDVEDLASYLVEGARSVDSVTIAEVDLPNAFLQNGITLVDTPGVGSLNPGYMAMTLAYVRSADALLFVSDASSPLTATEMEFLARARDRCPVVLPVMPKVDLFPDWRRVAEISGRSLERVGLPLPVPVSSVLRMIALDAGRPDLNARSGFPELLSTLDSQVLQPASQLAAGRAESDLERVIGQLHISTRGEREALEDPAGPQERLDELNGARERFEHLRASGARWATVMNDGFADVVAEVEHTFRGSLRVLTREVEERIEVSDPAKEWEATTTEVRDRVARAAEAMVEDLEKGSAKVATDILELLREEDLEVGELARGSVSPDVTSLWLGKDITTPTLASAAGTGYAGLRGAQGGILVFGMLANLAGIALSTMTLAGIGLIFGGKQLFDDRRRQVAARRQQARTTIRQFLDDVQFQVSKDMRDLSRELQRGLRDHFQARIAEMTRTYAEAADSLQKALRQSESAREDRLKVLRAIESDIAGLQDALNRVSSE
jgi:hypothetical protein